MERCEKCFLEVGSTIEMKHYPKIGLLICPECGEEAEVPDGYLDPKPADEVEETKTEGGVTMSDYKECNVCGNSQEIATCFPKSPRMKDGHLNTCKKCQYERVKARKAAKLGTKPSPAGRTELIKERAEKLEKENEPKPIGRPLRSGEMTAAEFGQTLGDLREGLKELELLAGKLGMTIVLRHN